MLRRLASPKELQGDAYLMRSVIEHLNQILMVEGLEIVLSGIEPRVRARTAAVARSQSKDQVVETSPDFARLIADASLAEILTFHWEEAQRCVQAGAYLSAVIMMGSILEGSLLYKVEQNRETAGRAKRVPATVMGR